MKSFGAVMLTLVALVLAIIAFREARGARQARDEFATAAHERDALRERIDVLEKKQAALQTENDDLRTKAVAAAGVPAPGVIPRSFTAVAPRGRLNGPADVLETPEMRQLLAVTQKGRLDARYAPLFQALHLPPEKLDRLKQLLVDRQNAPADVVAAARKQGAIGPDSGSSIPGLIQQETQAVDASIRDLLGTTAYEEYQDFNRTQPERAVVDQLASRLSYSDAPLTRDQMDALVNLLSAERATEASTPAPADFGGVRFAIGNAGTDVVFSSFGPGAAPLLTDESLASAETLLSESQMSALRALQAEQQAQQKIGQMMQQTFPMSAPGGQATTVIALPASDSAPHP